MKTSLGAKTIALPLPAWVICTYDEQGNPNAMAASWTGVCCSDPPCVYFSARKSRYTYDCVVARQAFTICVPSADQAAATDYFGTASGRKASKIQTAGLTAAHAQHVDAPFIDEFPLIIECKLTQTHDLGSHTMFIGEIFDVKCEQSLLDADGNLDVAQLAAFVYSTADGMYYEVGTRIGKAYELGKSFTNNIRR